MPRYCSLLVTLSLLLCWSRANAFWVVNFGPASTLRRGSVGFAAGMGGQAVLVREPVKSNVNLIIPHAGLRVGLAQRLDFGLRLAPVPLPYSSVGPGFGANLDLKVRLTPQESRVHVALIAGIGLGHVLIQDNHRLAWSPNAAGLLTFVASERMQVTVMGRYVYLALPTAKGGQAENFVHIAGPSLGLKFAMHPRISMLPEVGVYWYEGAIENVRTRGPGFQFGFMLATTF